MANSRKGSNGHFHGSDHHEHDASECRHPGGLTRNESLVWDALSESVEPLKAYEILDKLKERGVRAPMTVYRALEGLEAKGLTHKLEGLNSFVLCKHEGPHDVQVFLVCETCASVTEVEIEGVEAALRPVIRRAAFQLNTARLEARGLCFECSKPLAAAAAAMNA
ncbi:MAG TPA: transcriptional repressor [Parvularcula sp.]|nr:transcriptional repressor [Parvularcula sp.]HBS31389.1 transcriptional repressor [Parvularcula sp.]HBS36175.1 transcriptional repressor [Parvularcula sp.]